MDYEKACGCRNNRATKNVSQTNMKLKQLHSAAAGDDNKLAAYKTNWAYAAGVLFNTVKVLFLLIMSYQMYDGC